MRLADFESMVRRLSAEVPADFFEAVEEVVVSPRTKPHPTRGDVYTLGECVPVERGAGEVRSRIVLYHGSFQALSRITEGFDWRAEAWETLTHELRHHLEWRAGRGDLEKFDRAAEHNFARRDGEAFDPLFVLDGEMVEPGVYEVDDDVFLDRLVRRVPETVDFVWHGARYRLAVPAGATLPAFIAVEGLDEPPPGEVVIVLRAKPSLRHLLRPASVWQGTRLAERVKGQDGDVRR